MVVGKATAVQEAAQVVLEVVTAVAARKRQAEQWLTILPLVGRNIWVATVITKVVAVEAVTTAVAVATACRAVAVVQVMSHY